jgi:hypothetical protein
MGLLILLQRINRQDSRNLNWCCIPSGLQIGNVGLRSFVVYVLLFFFFRENCRKRRETPDSFPSKKRHFNSATRNLSHCFLKPHLEFHQTRHLLAQTLHHNVNLLGGVLTEDLHLPLLALAHAVALLLAALLLEPLRFDPVRYRLPRQELVLPHRSNILHQKVCRGFCGIWKARVAEIVL